MARLSRTSEGRAPVQTDILYVPPLGENEVEKLISDKKQDLKKIGIVVKLVKIRKKDMVNPEVVGALGSRGVTRLPALLVANQVYTGYRAIKRHYELACSAPAQACSAPAQACSEPVAKDDAPDSLTAFYENQLYGGGDSYWGDTFGEGYFGAE